MGSQHVQWLICTVILKVKRDSKAVANCERPKFAACEFGNGNRQHNKVNTIKKNHMQEQELKKDHLLPGQMVYADNYILRDLGILYHTKGKSDPSDLFLGGCVFIDNVSVHVRINHQLVIKTTKTVKARLTFWEVGSDSGSDDKHISH